MSDFHDVTQKLKEGAEWRGSIEVTMDGEAKSLTVRQLRDPEFEQVMDQINRDELREYREALPEDLVDEYQDLQDEEELDDEQEERLAEVEDALEEEGPDIFDFLSTQTMAGIRQAGKFAVVPDDEDMRQAFMDDANQIEEEYGIKVQQPEDTKPYLDDVFERRIENATNFVSFQIGMQALMETMGAEGN